MNSRKRGLTIFVLFSVIVMTIGFVLANGSGDVAYIAKNGRADAGFVDALEDKGLDVDVIPDWEIPGTDFSEYDLVFIGDDGHLRNAEHLYGNNMVITSSYNGYDLGVTDRDGVSRLAANMPLRVNKDGEVLTVYTRPTFIRRVFGVPYYYLANRDMVPGWWQVAGTYNGNVELNLGDVVSYYEGGEGEGEHRKCFFGIIKTKQWTDEARELFTDCVDFVMSGEQGGEGIHDVSLDDLKFKDSEGSLIDLEGFSFISGESYKILIDVMNDGDFVEDVTFDGEIRQGQNVVKTFSHVAVNDLDPGEKKNDKTRTVLFDIAEGDYTVEVEAIIDVDDVPGNNVVSQDISVIED